VGISFASRKVVLGFEKRERYYDFSQISNVEIVVNGVSVSKIGRGSQLFGAVMGGLAFGGVGAIVGGMSGTTVARTHLTHLTLRVTVDDPVAPVHYVSFYHSDTPTGDEATGFLVTQCKATAERVHAHFVNAMRQVQGFADTSKSSSISELHKLFELRKAGVISFEDFSTQKRRIMEHGLNS
jgi:hypothetical protein